MIKLSAVGLRQLAEHRSDIVIVIIGQLFAYFLGREIALNNCKKLLLVIAFVRYGKIILLRRRFRRVIASVFLFHGQLSFVWNF